jgi:hypothetical protein
MINQGNFVVKYEIMTIDANAPQIDGKESI